jgi:hypothetical protein
LRCHRRSCAIALIGLVLMASEQRSAAALGSRNASVSPWNPHHIDRLPPEVRDVVSRMCGRNPRATQYFATYLDNSRVIRLNFERLSCDDQGSICKQTSCLRQEYGLWGGHYRLSKSYYREREN